MITLAMSGSFVQRIKVSMRYPGVSVCWLACEDKDTRPRDLSERLMAVKTTWWAVILLVNPAK